MALPDENLPSIPENKQDFPSAVRKRVKALRTWREMRAKDLAVEAGTLLK